MILFLVFISLCTFEHDDKIKLYSIFVNTFKTILQIQVLLKLNTSGSQEIEISIYGYDIKKWECGHG